MYWYGDLDVAGLTLSEIKVKVIGLLQKFIRDEYLGTGRARRLRRARGRS